MLFNKQNRFIQVSTLINAILAIKPFHGCDYFQNVEVGESYDIFSPGYNRNTVSNREGLVDCRWAAIAPVGHILLLECDDIFLPLSNNCKKTRIEVSASGKSNLSDADRFCGSRPFQALSKNNQIVVALREFNTTSGEFFKCRLSSVSATFKKCECGHRKNTRIVGGVEAGVNEFPMTAGLVSLITETVFCGATIIATKYAVTAAHCLGKEKIKHLGLLVGDHDYRKRNDTKFAALHRLSGAIVHSEYSSVDNRNDIALVQTSTSIIFNEAVGAVCLPFRYSFMSEQFANEVVEATGWGTTEFSGPLSPTLQKVKLNVISNQKCSKSYPEGISRNQVCTFAVDKDTCQFDSGGGLYYTEVTNSLLYLVGVVSFGRGCATTSPGVNTRVTSYLNWIQYYTPEIQYCIR